MLFFSSLATGSVIGLLITPIAYFYEKNKKEESNDKKLFRWLSKPSERDYEQIKKLEKNTTPQNTEMG